MDSNFSIIKRVAMETLGDCKVMLFGSRARGEQRADSDYDILLVINKELPIEEKLTYKSMFRKMCAKNGIDTDVFIESETEIERKRQLLGHVIREAMKEAIYI